jgi:hypothetical protein
LKVQGDKGILNALLDMVRHFVAQVCQRFGRQVVLIGLERVNARRVR